MDHNIMQIQRAAAQQPPSPYHVYPLAHNPIQHAFQIQGSPLLATKRQQLMEMTNQMMPQSRDGTPSMRHVARTAIQETSFITDTEEQVQKINAMFPTVPIYHIRTLMKKYMKSLYPAAEETLILDILAGSDNNVQKTSEKLKALGYEKRDRLSLRRKKELEEEQKKEETIIVVRVRAKTNEDKLNLKLKLQGLYKDIPEKIVVMACDSVNYDEGRAIQILNIVVDDNDNDLKNVKQKTDADDNDDLSSRGNSLKRNQEVEKVTDEMVKVIAKTKCYKSMISRPNAVGANSQLKKGQNEDLLLADYVTWNGSSPNFARGANKDICKGRKITATGPNVENCKGSRQLPKGSIYQKIQLICN